MASRSNVVQSSAMEVLLEGKVSMKGKTVLLVSNTATSVSTISLDSKREINDHTVSVQPAVSAGNVGQLAVGIDIHSKLSSYHDALR